MDPKKVLLVDDEPAILELLKEFFTTKGFEVQTAGCDSEAMAIASEGNLDLVISDIDLTVTDGLDLLKELKTEHPDLPVIMLTGMGYDEALIGDAQENGASGFVSKHLPVSQLYMEVRRILKRVEAAKQRSDSE
jgi:two-component system nitrogen regulation response regulator NtrX